jgi:hypothetical protein
MIKNISFLYKIKIPKNRMIKIKPHEKIYESDEIYYSYHKGIELDPYAPL